MSTTLAPANAWPTKLLFVPPGLIFGSWAIRIPDIAHAAHVTTSTVGAALLVLALGTLLGMPAASAALTRFNTKPVAATVLACTAASSLLLGGAGSAATLFIAAFLLGITSGIYSVTINTAAAHAEDRLSRPVLTGCYAAYSLATLAASIIAGLAVGAALNPLAHLLVVNTVTLVALAGVFLIDNAPRPDAFRIPRPTSRKVWVAAAIGFAALFGEGVITDWSAYFLRAEILGSADARQAWGYTSFAICMVIGRSLGATLIARIGERRLLLAAVVLGVVGGTAVAASPNLSVALIGYASAGLGLANLYPMTISLAARAAAAHRQDAITSVSSIGYLGLLLGPATVGLCSSVITLRGALLLPPLMLCAVALCIGTLVSHRRR
ncbi:MFS transporter [Nocardia australiensis]|uniref:MFS transporter n=1 Tax=Nocardia australiensis TaxID=2887191 RepID=UPI001D13E7C1|nr:MFS transporter [Nocardia australiensis]